MLRIPGLIDPHVHMREPGALHKEDWSTGTKAALAGGFTLVLAMPNTQPAVVDEASLDTTLTYAGQKAFCDYAQYLGANAENAVQIPPLAKKAAGLKMYLDQTYGSLRLDELSALMDHFQNWPVESPLVVHAEGRSLATALLLAKLFDRPVHVAHVSRADEIRLIRQAKEKGLQVTCEVTAHHLFLDQENCAALPSGHQEVRPRLATPVDRQALWDNLDVVDCFASDHAPHTLTEKDSQNPPPGFPGLETSLPLFLTAMHAGKLSLEDLLLRSYHNPLRIFHLPEQPETWVEIDENAVDQISAGRLYTRAAWTPYNGWPVRGKIQRVFLRGQPVFENENILSMPGTGHNIRSTN